MFAMVINPVKGNPFKLKIMFLKKKAFILGKCQEQFSNFRVDIPIVTYEDNTMATASFNTLSPNRRA